MGIKGLWSVLTPFSEKKSLHELRGETIAVDLSGWVCDSQNVTEHHVQPKLYLRNLFFRTVYLLLAEINPIFVLEGDAPELKRDVMATRNAVQFRGAAPRSEKACSSEKLPNVSRKRFKNVLKECETLLKSMGVICLKGSGEAEATCAQLNAEGFVDAVVSQDSDCFAYGAKRVYRNFSVSSSAGGGAMQGSVDCYDAEKLYKSNGFGRNKMVALALLCGCDYVVGACGSSITTAVQFLHTVADDDVIPRLLSWVSDPDCYERRARWASAPGRCDRCGHVGRTHLRNGCPVCATDRGCNDLGHKSKVAEAKRELSLRSRALSSGVLFPEPRVMKEFLKPTIEKIELDSLKTPVPSLIQFVKLMVKKLDWSERYCVEKFLPLLTKFHLQERVPSRTVQPIRIKKKRNPRGVPSYEVVWADVNGVYEALIPDDQFEEDEDPSVVWTSTERQDLMRQFYPKIVEAFEESIKKPLKAKKSRTKKKKEEKENIQEDKPKRRYNRKPKNNVEILILNESNKHSKFESNSSKLNVSVSVNKLKRKLKNTKKSTQKTMDSFIAKKKKKSLRNSLVLSVRRSFKNLSIAEDKKINKNKNFLSILNKSDELDHSDLSGIIETIISRSPVVETAKVENKTFKLVFDKYSTPTKFALRKTVLSDIQNNCSTPKDSPKNSFNASMKSKLNTSYFFDKLTEERDAFEMSLDYKHNSAVIVEYDKTLDYSLPEVW
ncbi:flap endonuclease GEN isoform X1 [Bombyx mori]|uniref:Flap endonuclease GEN n=2 Tax=Bombyx mori TaxID=7091 RepID=A0A8R1WIK8_BOMMO|nr:flap endonuclease GEN isoform X2 [Bombyx mori]